jgi:hypothetical protein
MRVEEEAYNVSRMVNILLADCCRIEIPLTKIKSVHKEVLTALSSSLQSPSRMKHFHTTPLSSPSLPLYSLIFAHETTSYHYPPRPHPRDPSVHPRFMRAGCGNAALGAPAVGRDLPCTRVGHRLRIWGGGYWYGCTRGLGTVAVLRRSEEPIRHVGMVIHCRGEVRYVERMLSKTGFRKQ